jgi:hypothetical protein
MRRTSRCRHFLILCTLVVGSAPAAVAGQLMCSAQNYFPAVGTRAGEIDGLGTQSPALRPQDIDPARSQLRPASCTCNTFVQHQSSTYEGTSRVSCDDAASKIAAAANAEATNVCCNLGGGVCYESPVQRSFCADTCPPHGGCYELFGYIFYECQSCDPPIC